MPGRRALPAASGRLTPSAPKSSGCGSAVRPAEKADAGRQEVAGGEVVVGGIDLAERQRDAAVAEILDQVDGELLGLVAVPGAGPFHHVERPERPASGGSTTVWRRKRRPSFSAEAISRCTWARYGTVGKLSGATRSRPPSSARVAGVHPERGFLLGPTVLGLGVAAADAVPDLVEAGERIELLGAGDDDVVVARSRRPRHRAGRRGSPRTRPPRRSGPGRRRAAPR